MNGLFHDLGRVAVDLDLSLYFPRNARWSCEHNFDTVMIIDLLCLDLDLLHVSPDLRKSASLDKGVI
jgi:hypothetical protein